MQTCPIEGVNSFPYLDKFNSVLVRTNFQCQYSQFHCLNLIDTNFKLFHKLYRYIKKINTYQNCRSDMSKERSTSRKELFREQPFSRNHRINCKDKFVNLQEFFPAQIWDSPRQLIIVRDKSLLNVATDDIIRFFIVGRTSRHAKAYLLEETVVEIYNDTCILKIQQILRVTI